jgi:hypothetical protein
MEGQMKQRVQSRMLFGRSEERARAVAWPVSINGFILTAILEQ